MIEDNIDNKVLEENYNKYKNLFIRYSKKEFEYKESELFVDFPSFNSFEEYFESEEIQNFIESYELHADYNEEKDYKRDISDKIKNGTYIPFAYDMACFCCLEKNTNNIVLISYSETEYYIDNIPFLPCLI